MGTEKLNDTIHNLREWRRILDEAQSMVDSLTDSVKAEMKAQKTDTLSGPDWKVTWKEGTQTRLDTTAFKKAYPDLYAAYSVKSLTRRFLLT